VSGPKHAPLKVSLSLFRSLIITLRGGNSIKSLWFVVSLIPSPFLFHYLEIVLSPRPAILLSGTFLLVIIAGLLSVKIKFPVIILTNIITILISVFLGTEFITPPNPSWFNPFGRNFAIIATGIVMLIGLLLIRFITKSILLKIKH
jgi:hypothetical protein